MAESGKLRRIIGKYEKVRSKLGAYRLILFMSEGWQYNDIYSLVKAKSNQNEQKIFEKVEKNPLSQAEFLEMCEIQKKV